MNQLQKNHLTILAIFALAVIPFLAAWYMARHPELLSSAASNGVLITPPITTQADEFVGGDTFSTDNIKELQGHWVLINVALGLQCEPLCQDALYKSRQLSLMMGKDVTRLRRLVLISGSGVSMGEWKDDARLLKARPVAALLERLQQATGGKPEDGSLYLMDPLGNVMMRYAPGYDPYQVKADLAKLLRISQIG